MRTLQTYSVRNRALPLALSLALLAVLACMSICMGSARITAGDLLSAIRGTDTSSTAYRIVRYVRLPRTFAAVLSGLALGIGGYLLQSALNNPLASVNIIGVNSGAGFALVLFSALFPNLVRFSIFASFAGALAAVFVVFAIAKATGASRTTIILAGVAISSFFAAGCDAVITVFPDTQMQRIEFIIGSFASVSSGQLRLCAPPILVASICSLFLRRGLSLLLLGEETATSLGLNARRVRFLSLFLSAILAGSVVSMAGLVGFVALVVPHIGRMLMKEDNRNLLPFCGILGSVMALGCDLVARTLFSPYEVPVGIVLSFLGSPFFLFLLFDRKRRSILA